MHTCLWYKYKTIMMAILHGLVFSMFIPDTLTLLCCGIWDKHRKFDSIQRIQDHSHHGNLCFISCLLNRKILFCPPRDFFRYILTHVIIFTRWKHCSITVTYQMSTQKIIRCQHKNLSDVNTKTYQMSTQKLLRSQHKN